MNLSVLCGDTTSRQPQRTQRTKHGAQSEEHTKKHEVGHRSGRRDAVAVSLPLNDSGASNENQSLHRCPDCPRDECRACEATRVDFRMTSRNSLPPNPLTSRRRTVARAHRRRRLPARLQRLPTRLLFLFRKTHVCRDAQTMVASTWRSSLIA